MKNDRRPITEISALLRDARFMQQLSLREAAWRIGISASTLSRIEAVENPHVPDFDSLRLAAEWIGLEVCLLPAARSPEGGPNG